MRTEMGDPGDVSVARRFSVGEERLRAAAGFLIRLNGIRERLVQSLQRRVRLNGKVRRDGARSDAGHAEDKGLQGTPDRIDSFDQGGQVGLLDEHLDQGDVREVRRVEAQGIREIGTAGEQSGDHRRIHGPDALGDRLGEEQNEVNG